LTGPGPGKIRLNAKVKVFLPGRGLAEINADVYLHVKGWSRARVTHIDVESSNIVDMLGLKVGEGVYGLVEGVGCGLRFAPFRRGWRVLVCEDNVLPRALPSGTRVKGYLGAKVGGVYIGMEKVVLEVLERIAAEEFKIPPKGRK
jgi:hypothetical protein